MFAEGSTIGRSYVFGMWRELGEGQHINEREKQVEIYQKLRVLLTETEVSHFSVLLKEFVIYIEKHHYDL